MNCILTVGDLAVFVTYKNIKNIYLRVCPPDGRVAVSAPGWATGDQISRFVLSKYEWIEKRQKILRQSGAGLISYAPLSIHQVWGVEYELHILSAQRRPFVEDDREKRHLIVHAPAGATSETVRKMLGAWYGRQVVSAATQPLRTWRARLRLPDIGMSARPMKSRWGSCMPYGQRITLNSWLGRYNPVFLEYVLVHELAHFLEPNHGPGFHRLMDGFMPGWKSLRQGLNAHALV